MKVEQKLISTHDAAKILGVSFKWVHLRTKENRIPSVMMGGKKFIHVDTINKILVEGVE